MKRESKVFLGPFDSLVLVAMAEGKSIDLLLQFFQRKLVVIPHAEIFLNGIIFT